MALVPRDPFVGALGGGFYDDPFTSMRRDIDRMFGDALSPGYDWSSDPRRMVQDLWRGVGGALDRPYRGGGGGGELAPVSTGFDWMPRVDVRESDKEYMVHADLPGVRKEDIHVDVDGNLLTLSGDTKFEDEKREGNYIRRERRTGTFQRTFRLPGLRHVDPKEIATNYNQGVLEVRVPKKEEVRRAASIAIQGAEQQAQAGGTIGTQVQARRT